MHFQSQGPRIWAVEAVALGLLLCLGWNAQRLIAAESGASSKPSAQTAEMAPAAATEVFRPSVLHTPRIDVNVQMVVVGVTVIDPQGRIVTGLNKNDFRNLR